MCRFPPGGAVGTPRCGQGDAAGVVVQIALAVELAPDVCDRERMEVLILMKVGGGSTRTTECMSLQRIGPPGEGVSPHLARAAGTAGQEAGLIP